MKFIKNSILILVLVGILAVPFVVDAQVPDPDPIDSTVIDTLIDLNNSLSPGVIMATALKDAGLQKTLSFFAQIVLSLTAFLLWLAGMILNSVIEYTIVDAAKNLGTSGQGLFDTINEVWGTIRDLANIAFIFVLLYAAIRKIFGLEQNIGTVIRNVVIIGLLINFSLFLTKVVIDASNVVTLGFYNSIQESSSKAPIKIGDRTFTTVDVGFAGIFMDKLGIASLYNSEDTGSALSDNPAGKIALIGFFGSILMIVTTFVFLAMAIVLLVRFVILVILMILSPLAFIAFIIPGLKGKWDDWWNALKDQAMFAPVFMAMMWIVIRIMSSESFLGLRNPQETKSLVALADGGNTELMFNFVLVIGFTIAALIISKKIASSHGVGALIGGVQKGAGAVIFGGAGFAGRQLIGRRAAKVLKDENLQERAKSGDMSARMQLATANKLSKSSFDVRSSKTLGKLDSSTGGGLDLGSYGKGGGEGGFKQIIKDKVKRKEEYNKEVFGGTPEENEADKKEKERLKDRYDTAVGNEKKSVNKNEKRTKEERETAKKDLEEEKKMRDKATSPEIRRSLETEVSKAEARLDMARKAHDLATINKEKVIEDKIYSENTKNIEKAYKDFKGRSQLRMEAYADRLGGKFGAGNKAAAVAVRKVAGGKSNKEKFADAAKALADEDVKATEEPTEEKPEEGGEGKENIAT